MREVCRPCDESHHSEEPLPVVVGFPLVQSVQAIAEANKHRDTVKELAVVGVHCRLQNIRKGVRLISVQKVTVRIASNGAGVPA